MHRRHLHLYSNSAGTSEYAEVQVQVYMSVLLQYAEADKWGYTFMIGINSTIHEYMFYWNTPECSPLFTQRMRDDRLRYINRNIAPCIGLVRMKDFTSSHVRKLRLHLADSGLSEAMQFIILRVFRQAMLHAKNHCIILDSCCDRLYLPYIFDSEVRIFTPEEINLIFASLEHQLLGNYYKLIYFTGMQSMEARALRLCDIDLANSILHVEQRIYGKTLRDSYIEPISDPLQRRIIYLTDESKAVILDEMQRRKRKTLRASWRETGQDLLFVYNNGSPITDNYNRQTRILIEAITGIKNFNTLSLRYTAADAALNTGATEKVIQDILGFKSLRYVYRMKNKFIHE